MHKHKHLINCIASWQTRVIMGEGRFGGVLLIVLHLLQSAAALSARRM